MAKLETEVLFGNRCGWYVNKNGGICPCLYDCIEECDAGHWPDQTEEDQIEITKWPGGSHYYAKVRGVDVVDEKGNVKWKTVRQAEQAVKYFANVEGAKDE